MRRINNALGDVQDRPERWEPVNPDLKNKVGKVPWRNTTNFLNLPFIVGTTSLQVLQANLSRVYLLIQNNSAGTMYVVFNNNANIVAGIQIPAGGNYEPYIAPYSGIYIIGSAVTLAGVAVEGVRG